MLWLWLYIIFDLFQASVNTTKTLLLEKRLKREHAADRVRDGLMEGKWLW